MTADASALRLKGGCGSAQGDFVFYGPQYGVIEEASFFTSVNWFLA